MSAAALSLLSVVLVSLISLMGLATLSLRREGMHRLTAALVSFAVGALLGDAFIHLIPEAFAGEPSPLRPSLLILGGMLLFFLLEKFLRHRHGLLHRHHHSDEKSRPPLAAINVIGDAIHNFIDGVLIGASYLVSPALGLSTTVAILFHEIPQELGDFGILIHSGLSVRKAVLFNFASASVAILGTVTALVAGAMAGTIVTSVLVPLAAGGFVYIAAADLIPELQHERTLRGGFLQAGLISLGIAIMVLLATLE